MGPPTAGKTTYVQHNAKPGDLIVDTDAIALALGAKPGHTTAGLHAGFARSCRSHVITTVLTKGAEVPTWIIDTAPTIAAIEHYTRASAHPHLIDPGKGTCLQRARTRGKGTTPAILDWYTHHHDRLTAWTHTTPTPPAPTTTATREW
ncbi:MAG: hypothetical protein SHS37scaffold537_48 [Phage 68_12]|nr:MAG: hypothetical protein SHS37scaffold537_48 [Phage 68_12]